MTSTSETAPNATRANANRSKLFYGWWMLVGAAVLSFVAALVSLLDQGTFRDAIVDSLFETAPGYRVGFESGYLGSILPSFVTGLVIAPVVGCLLDRHGPRPIMLTSVLVTGCCFLLITQVQNELQMDVALWVIWAGIFVITSVVLVGALGKWFVRGRVLAFAIVSACSTLGSLFLLSPISAIHEFGWQIMAIVAGVTFLIVGIPVALMMRRQPEDHGLLPDGVADNGDLHSRWREKALVSARLIIRTPAFWQLTLAVGLVLLAMSTRPLDPENATRLLEVLLDVRLGNIVWIWNLGIVLEVVGIVAIGFISLHLGKRILILASCALLVVAYPGIWVIYLADSFSLELPVFFISLLGISIGKAAIVMLQFAILADFFGRRNFGLVLGMAIAVRTVADFLFSYLHSYGYVIALDDLAQFGFGMIALMVAVFLVLKVEPQSRVAARIRLLNRA